MSEGSAQALFVSGAALFTLLGAVHGLLTLRDIQAPRSFTPTDDSVRRAMVGARLRLAPQMTIWDAWLGFHFSHSLGLILFGTLFGWLALDDFGLVTNSRFLQATAIVVALAYSVLALRFWFWVPAVASAIGTFCFAAAVVWGGATA